MPIPTPRLRFNIALAVFVAWVAGLGVMALRSSEKPRDIPPAAAAPE